ncbi:MAG: hypothetical protein FWE18_06725 [Alphaproteobacteria bacterium]|nr:hypothetical protein [Alphaproteobacteria bacterium]
MENQNSKPKSKKILWLLIFLIIVILVIAIGIYVKNNQEEFFPQKPKDILNQYKSSATTLLKEDSNKIQELQNTIKDLQQKISTAALSSNNNNQNLNFAVYSSLLINRVLRGDSFSMEIEQLLSTTNNPLLRNKLERIIPASNIGIKTAEELTADYKAVYKDTYLAYLKGQNSLIAKIKSYFLFLIFIKQSRDIILDDNTTTSTLANVEVYVRNNNFKKAYAEFLKIDAVPNTNTQQWLSNLMDRISAEDAINEIHGELTKYIAESR